MPLPVPGEGRSRLREKLLAIGGSVALRLLRSTVRLKFHEDAQIRDFERHGKRFILAFWHRHLLLMRYAYQGPRMTTLASRSRDGEIIARVLPSLGIEVVRGSTSREAVSGLRRLLRAAADGSDLAVTPDGPRGPARVVQPGVAFVARVAGMPVLPASLDASSRWVLRSWDRMIVPKPGAAVHVVFGRALDPPRNQEGERELLGTLQSVLNGLEAEAARLAGVPCEA